MDDDEAPFATALAAFSSRTCYANADGDHLVAWANASLRLEAELPPLPERPSIGVFREDSYEAGCFPPMVCSNGASEEADQESEHPARPRLLKAVRGSVVVEQSHCGAATAASAGSDASAICNGSAVSDDSAASNSSAVSNASAVCNGSAVSDGSAVFNASAACNGSAVSDGRTASCTSSSGSHENLEALPSNANSIKCDSCSCTHIYHCGCQNRHPNQKEQQILLNLTTLPWRRIDVSFAGAGMPKTAHNLIQVTRRWLNREGMPVVRHLADLLSDDSGNTKRHMLCTQSPENLQKTCND